VEPRTTTEECPARQGDEREPTGRPPLHARWLGRVAYRDAWLIQLALARARAAGALEEDQLLLLEHDPVLTLGRNADAGHVLATAEQLAARGIEVIRVERGGEVTYHGPGQLVAYPVMALGTGAGATGVRAYVTALEGAMADTCARAGVNAGPRPGHPGAWVGAQGSQPAKIGALGIRIARGVSYHGVALNVSTNLADFDLIDPCGMPGLTSTSLARELARSDANARPPDVATAGVDFARALAARLQRRMVGVLPPQADPAAERRALDALVESLDAFAGDA
jgi:lipoyl(octanoyl) transferase